MRVVITGGGKVGFYLAKALVDNGHTVHLIEKQKARFNILHDLLGDAAVLGDACEARSLERANIEQADVVVAVTGDDEDNAVICQLARRKFGVPRTIARANNPKNEDTLRLLGVDNVVSSTKIIYALVEQQIDSQCVVALLTFQRGKLEIVQAQVQTGSPLVGKKVSDITLPKECVLISILRGDNVIVPNGDTVIHARDAIIALLPTAKVPEFQAQVVGRQ